MIPDMISKRLNKQKRVETGRHNVTENKYMKNNETLFQSQLKDYYFQAFHKTIPLIYIINIYQLHYS